MCRRSSARCVAAGHPGRTLRDAVRRLRAAGPRRPAAACPAGRPGGHAGIARRRRAAGQRRPATRAVDCRPLRPRLRALLAVELGRHGPCPRHRHAGPAGGQRTTDRRAGAAPRARPARTGGTRRPLRLPRRGGAGGRLAGCWRPTSSPSRRPPDACTSSTTRSTRTRFASAVQQVRARRLRARGGDEGRHRLSRHAQALARPAGAGHRLRPPGARAGACRRGCASSGDGPERGALHERLGRTGVWPIASTGPVPSIRHKCPGNSPAWTSPRRPMPRPPAFTSRR